MFFFRFTLYPAHSGVGGGNLTLLSVPYIQLNSGGIVCWVAELNARLTSLPERGYKNIKYFISSSGNRTHLVFSHTFVPLRHNWPQKRKVHRYKINRIQNYWATLNNSSVSWSSGTENQCNRVEETCFNSNPICLCQRMST